MPRNYREEVPDGTFHYRTTRTIRRGNGEIRLGFEWFGGAYIQVCKREAFRSPQEVINVWDYDSDSPRIPRTVGAVEGEITRWIDNYGPADLIHDVTHNWQ